MNLQRQASCSLYILHITSYHILRPSIKTVGWRGTRIRRSRYSITKDIWTTYLGGMRLGSFVFTTAGRGDECLGTKQENKSTTQYERWSGSHTSLEGDTGKSLSSLFDDQLRPLHTGTSFHWEGPLVRIFGNG
jgi:hypothetical protein